MDRSDDLTLPADTAWLYDEDTQIVCRAITAEGGNIYFVGGCVRDALLGVNGSDVDMSTDVLPQEVMRLANQAGLKAVPTGIDHGTVTVVSGGQGFEVTTFRKDVETDGRRAVVSFSDDISDDALRRDFTLNALYARPDGKIVDPLSGLSDCLNRRIRFIEDADTRIREDYLRILRFFRFHAWYARPDDGYAPDTLDAIARNIGGLETLSAERVGSEMVKLLCAPDPVSAIAVMRQTGCLSIVLPGSDDQFLGPIVHLAMTQNLPPDPMLRLAILGGEDVVDRFRLSRADARYLTKLNRIGYDATPLVEVAYREGAAIARGAALIRSAVSNMAVDASEWEMIEIGSTRVFPVSAQHLMPEYQGQALGDKLTLLEKRWVASGFSLSRDELLDGK